MPVATITDYLTGMWAFVENAHLPVLAQIAMVMVSSFISEDITILTTLLLTSGGVMSPYVFWLGNSLGLVAGDMLLYGAGWAIARHRPRFLGFNLPKLQAQASRYPVHSFILILLARFFPGTRLPAYVSAGLSRYSPLLFCIATLVSVFAWVALVFFAGAEVVALIVRYQARWWMVLAAAGLLYLLLRKLGRLLLIWMDPWQRRAWLAGWRRYLYYEFWPAKWFYLPIGFYYAWLALRHGHPLLPSAANPGIHTGGLVGESKAQVLDLIPPAHPALLPYAQLGEGTDRLAQVQDFMARHALTFPLILKPDHGQRGGSVTLVRDGAALETCLQDSGYPLLAQEYCPWPHELGVFYVRHPQTGAGQVFSVTEKLFPAVTGDGRTQLGDLILQDRRARLIAATYFRRFAGRLEEVLPPGQSLKLVESGNHCQGSIFRDGEALVTPGLQQAIDDLVRQMPGFYVGRIDLRYENPAALARGEFRVIEINGAGAEATHIYDESLTLWQAWRVLCQQWQLMFAIGAVNRQQGQRPISVWNFLNALFKYMWMARHYRIAS